MTGRLFNLGSLCIDHVYTVANIVSEGQTLASTGYSVFCGGKGLNQSIAAAKGGAAVVHLGAVGSDGGLLLSALTEAGVDVSGVRQLSGASGHAVIQVSETGGNAIVIAGGANRLIDEAVIHDVFARMEGDDWLLLQNEINDVDQILNAAQSRGVKVALNVAPADGREAQYNLGGVNLLIVNRDEATALASGGPDGSQSREPRVPRSQSDDVPRHADAVALLSILSRRAPNARIVLTLGDAGLYALDPSEPGSHGFWFLPPCVVQPVDETGAGDSFIGYLMAQLLKGAAFVEALEVAAAAGAVAVTAAGAAAAIPLMSSVQALRQAQPISAVRLETQDR